AALQVPGDGEEGNTGRNAFKGAGFSNIDASFSRNFAVAFLGEQTRLVIRADVFNILNHANLENPYAYLGMKKVSSSFGNALYGRTATNSGFPALTPVIENAREIHFMVRLEF